MQQRASGQLCDSLGQPFGRTQGRGQQRDRRRPNVLQLDNARRGQIGQPQQREPGRQRVAPPVDQHLARIERGQLQFECAWLASGKWLIPKSQAFRP